MRFQFLAVATPGSLEGRLISKTILQERNWLTVNVTRTFLEESCMQRGKKVSIRHI